MNIQDIPGVTVIKTIPEATTSPTTIFLFIIGALLLIFSFAISYIHHKWWFLGLCCTVCLIFSYVFLSFYQPERYQIITDDTVAVNQILEKYEIIDIDEKIITVQERLEDNE